MDSANCWIVNLCRLTTLVQVKRLSVLRVSFGPYAKHCVILPKRMFAVGAGSAEWRQLEGQCRANGIKLIADL